ncbi:MAG: hypothetical protein DRP59_04085 [Spirochaetes bacterium]|nr:MAG: hypothetical protein DRP59_04085 [Spirochaetota bacterium]
MFTGSRFNLFPNRKRITAAVLFILLLSAVSFSDTLLSGARIHPDSFWIQASLWPDSLSAEQVIESSLAASGLSADRAIGYKTRYKELAASLKAKDGDSLLQLLHSRVYLCSSGELLKQKDPDRQRGSRPDYSKQNGRITKKKFTPGCRRPFHRQVDF